MRVKPVHLVPRALFVLALVALEVMIGGQPASAAPGDLIADVLVPEAWPRSTAPSVAFEGRYLYYTDYAGPILHRIDFPPPGGPSLATGHVVVPITGAPSVVRSIAISSTRALLLAV